METEQKIKRWKEYLEELYNGNLNESVLEKEETLEKDDKGEYILQSEFDAAVEYTKNNKASGIDEIPVELIKNGGQVTKTKLYEICNEIYQKGVMINDCKHGLVVTLPKKRGTMKCEEHRTINLTSHASKIMQNNKDTNRE